MMIDAGRYPRKREERTDVEDGAVAPSRSGGSDARYPRFDLGREEPTKPRLPGSPSRELFGTRSRRG